MIDCPSSKARAASSVRAERPFIDHAFTFVISPMSYCD